MTSSSLLGEHAHAGKSALDRLSTIYDHLSTVDRPSIDHLPTISRPSTDRRSTIYRPPTDHLSTVDRPRAPEWSACPFAWPPDPRTFFSAAPSLPPGVREETGVRRRSSVGASAHRARLPATPSSCPGCGSPEVLRSLVRRPRRDSFSGRETSSPTTRALLGGTEKESRPIGSARCDALDGRECLRLPNGLVLTARRRPGVVRHPSAGVGRRWRQQKGFSLPLSCAFECLFRRGDIGKSSPSFGRAQVDRSGWVETSLGEHPRRRASPPPRHAVVVAALRDGVVPGDGLRALTTLRARCVLHRHRAATRSSMFTTERPGGTLGCWRRPRRS